MEAFWLIVFVTVWIIHLILFGMQRATLLISRNVGIEWKGGGSLLLPKWYRLTWIVIIAQWMILLSIAIFWNWKYAIIILVISTIIQSVIPIPYSKYKRTFKKRINQIRSVDPDLSSQLQKLLDSAPF